MSDNIKEIEPSQEQEVPEGYLGNLTDVQHDALVQMWKSYFEICDKARGNAKKGAGGFKEDKTGKDPKKSGIPDDDAAKDEVKKQQEQQGMNDLLETYGSEALRDSWWNFVKGDNPDGTMLRFVRARKGDAGRALAMMATMLRWRLDTDVETLVEKGDLVNGKEIPKFIEQQKSGKVFSIGCTGSDEPICYVIMKYHSVWGQPAASMQQFIVTQMETFRLLMAPPTDKACIFFDLKGFGIKQMDFVALLYLVKVLESYYPESYVSNAPYIFWGFWKVVKNLLDPVVRNKIVFITGPAETGDHVPEDRMIKYCGGSVETEFKFVDPQPGENDIQKDKETRKKYQERHHKLTDQFEKVTREWCETGGKDEKLNEQRQVLIKKMRLSQFYLDPYVRGLTAYHRNGVIPMESPGIATFDYIVKGKTTRQVIGKPTCQKTLERELSDIAGGATTEEADKKTKDMIADGSWGDWRVDDNSKEIKAKAAASLEDLEGNKKPEQLLKSAPPVKETKSSKSTKKSGGDNDAIAAAAVPAAQKSESKPSSPKQSSPKPKKTASSTGSSDRTRTSPPPAADQKTEPFVMPYTATSKSAKVLKARGAPVTEPKMGMFGKLRAKIAAM